MAGRIGLGNTPYPIWMNPLAWTDMPLAKTELYGSGARAYISTEGFTEVAIHAVVYTASTSANSPVLFLEYSFDAVTWFTLSLSASIFTGATPVSAFQAIPVAARDRNNLIVRVVGQGGDGAADPLLANIMCLLR